MIRPLSIVVVALVLCALPARAQFIEATTQLEVLQLAERDDWMLRVMTASGDTVVGRVRTVDESRVELDGGSATLDELTRIERGERVGEGGRTGVIAGGVLVGTLFVIMAVTIPNDSDFDFATLGPVAAAGIAAGAILGGLLGSELDPARTEWRRVWPAGW